MTLHKGTSVVGFRAALKHPERRGWVGVFRLTEYSLSSTAPRVLLPDLTPVTSCKLKSCDSGPTRARSNFPGPELW